MTKPYRTVSKGDYIYAAVPGRGYVLEHRYVVELSLGRCLAADELVHHVNENKRDNRIENLQVISRAEHSKHHGSATDEYYHALLTFKCPICGINFTRAKGLCTTPNPCCSHSCAAKRGALLRKLKRKPT